VDFTIRDPIDGDFIFPVNPEEVRIRRERQFETATILSLGEIDLVQGERIKEIAFSSFFPKVHDSSYCRCQMNPAGEEGESDLKEQFDPTKHLDPQVAMNRLTSLLMRKTPIQLIISGTIINTPAYVTAHDSTFKGGEDGDVYFDITFRTYRGINIGQKSRASNRPDTKPVPKVYVVKSGDTLTAIAKRELGSSSKWQDIYNANKKVIGRNPDLIRPGQKLVMP